MTAEDGRPGALKPGRLPAVAVVGIGLYIVAFVVRQLLDSLQYTSGDVGFFFVPVVLHGVGIAFGMALVALGVVSFRRDRIAVPVGVVAGLCVLLWTVATGFYEARPDTQYVLAVGTATTLGTGVVAWGWTRLALRFAGRR